MKNDKLLSILKSNKSVLQCEKAIQGLDKSYINDVNSSLQKSISWVVYRGHQNAETRNLMVSDIYSIWDGFARYLDSQGINKIIPFDLFKKISFVEVGKLLDEDKRFFYEIGLTDEYIDRYYQDLERYKLKILSIISKNFKFQNLKLPKGISYDVATPNSINTFFSKNTGNTLFMDIDWARWGRGVCSIVAIVADVAAEIPTTGLATVSIVAGIVGAGSTVTNIPKSP